MTRRVPMARHAGRKQHTGLLAVVLMLVGLCVASGASAASSEPVHMASSVPSHASQLSARLRLPGRQAGIFNCLHYGAVGDGVTVDTAALQATIDAAGDAGGGVVLLPSGYTFMSGSLWLRSHVAFTVATNATLLGSTWYDAYPIAWRGPFYKNSRAGLLNGGKCLDKAANATCQNLRSLVNVTIEGGGTIDGQGWAWWYAFGPAIDDGGRPCVVEPMWVDGLTIRHVNVTQAAYYHVHPHLCSNVLIDEITVHAGVLLTETYESHNTDGIDPENCVNVTVQNSVVWAGDDCMAIDARAKYPPMENVLVKNVTCYTPFSLGSGTMGGVRNVTFDSCTVIGGWGHDHTYKPHWWHTAIRLKTCRGRGGYVKDITYRNIKAINVDLVFDFQMWYPCQNSSGMHNYFLCQDLSPRSPPDLTPYYENILFDGVYGSNVWRPAWLNCLPEAPCKNVTFRDINIDSELDWLCDNVKPTFEGTVTPQKGPTCFSG